MTTVYVVWEETGTSAVVEGGQPLAAFTTQEAADSYAENAREGAALYTEIRVEAMPMQAP